jgi:hypothetical protein
LPFQLQPLWRYRSVLESAAAFEYFGLTPPATFQWLAFRGREAERDFEWGWEFTPFVMGGLLVWAVAAALAYYLAGR